MIIYLFPPQVKIPQIHINQSELTQAIRYFLQHFYEAFVCGPCQLWKQTKAKHPSTQTSATSKPLELLHLDLMGPTRGESLGGKTYSMVVVDDFTRYTWVILLRSKLDASKHIEALCTRL